MCEGYTSIETLITCLGVIKRCIGLVLVGCGRKGWGQVSCYRRSRQICLKTYRRRNNSYSLRQLRVERNIENDLVLLVICSFFYHLVTTRLRIWSGAASCRI